MLIKPELSCLVVIDIQDKLAPAMQSPAKVIRNTALLMRAADRMGVPILMTEQYPKGLGRTVPQLQGIAPQAQVFEKIHFSCMNEELFQQAFEATGRRQVVITGMEAHICVMQTGVDLMDKGYEIFVVTDATASRTLESEQACLDRLGAAGAGIVTTEMVIYEWLGRAGTEAFKEMLPFIKNS